MNGARVAVGQAGATPVAAERALAMATGLPLLAATDPQASAFAFLLRVEPGGVTLHLNETKGPGGLRVDFASASLMRRAADSFRRQNLARAVGLRRGWKPAVLDATAGFGNDAWLLASAGCEVTLVERNKIVHALLADGLARASALQDCNGRLLKGRDVDTASTRMRLLQGDFASLAGTLPDFDVVCLDPMFPPDNKSARSGKAMYLLQRLLEPVAEDESLLRLAMDKARQRVVVKRAKRSGGFAGCDPDIAFQGASSRFDVYLKRNT